MNKDVHGRAFKRSPSGSSIGVLQREYGWLSLPSYWKFGHFIKDNRLSQNAVPPGFGV